MLSLDVIIPYLPFILPDETCTFSHDTYTFSFGAITIRCNSAYVDATDYVNKNYKLFFVYDKDVKMHGTITLYDGHVVTLSCINGVPISIREESKVLSYNAKYTFEDGYLMHIYYENVFPKRCNSVTHNSKHHFDETCYYIPLEDISVKCNALGRYIKTFSFCNIKIEHMVICDNKIYYVKKQQSVPITFKKANDILTNCQISQINSFYRLETA